MEKENQNKDTKIIKSCPRFSKCSCPICPLDANSELRVYVQGEPRCTLAKSIRLRLGKALPGKGLLPREIAGLKSWENKNKETVAENLRCLALWRAKKTVTPEPEKRKEEDDV